MAVFHVGRFDSVVDVHINLSFFVNALNIVDEAREAFCDIVWFALILVVSKWSVGNSHILGIAREIVKQFKSNFTAII